MVGLDKVSKFDDLLKELSSCGKCLNLKSSKGKDFSLINIYQKQDFCKKIPSIWTDWYRRLDAEIMIIGQDWGPYNDMEYLNKRYLEDESSENWNLLIESEKSNTKKLLSFYIDSSSQGKYKLGDIFVTNAIMCARKGNNYRGDNIDLKKASNYCSEFLIRQIEIVQPKVVLTLGYYPLRSLADYYGFNIQKTLKETILDTPEILCGDFVIIPLYHPVAQVRKEEQMKQYERIWKHINGECSF